MVETNAIHFALGDADACNGLDELTKAAKEVGKYALGIFRSLLQLMAGAATLCIIMFCNLIRIE